MAQKTKDNKPQEKPQEEEQEKVARDIHGNPPPGHVGNYPAPGETPPYPAPGEPCGTHWHEQ